MSDWGRTFNTGIVAALEQALNRALALDPVANKALIALLDEPFLLQLEPPGLKLYLTTDSRCVRLRSTCEVPPPSVILTGSPLAFAAVAFGDEEVFRDGRLTLEGDAARAHRLQRILQQLQPDWEASLADIIGDVPAHFFARRLRQGLQWSREARSALTRNLEEYLQEESGTVPARPEADALFEDIDALRLKENRLAARVRKLEEARDSAPENSSTSGKHE